jgi:hypothetical protein
MRIECILKRHGGTHIQLHGMEYHFEPLEDDAHVAEVSDESHIDMLLAIPEGYKVYHGKLSPKGKARQIGELTQPAPKATAKANQSAFLNGSDQHQSQYEIGGKVYAMGDIVRLAFEKSVLSNDEWNALDGDDIAAKLDIVLDELADAAEAGGSNDDKPADETPEQELVRLRTEYESKFGSKPHPAAKAETLKAKLAAE